jgi:NADPH-dependent curcumin reductase CurA
MNRSRRCQTGGVDVLSKSYQPKSKDARIHSVRDLTLKESFLLLRRLYSFDYAPRFGEAKKDISEWISQGKIKRKFHVVEGLEGCPDALQLLYSGGNTGKL